MNDKLNQIIDKIKHSHIKENIFQQIEEYHENKGLIPIGGSIGSIYINSTNKRYANNTKNQLRPSHFICKQFALNIIISSIKTTRFDQDTSGCYKKSNNANCFGVYEMDALIHDSEYLETMMTNIIDFVNDIWRDLSFPSDMITLFVPFLVEAFHIELRITNHTLKFITPPSNKWTPNSIEIYNTLQHNGRSEPSIDTPNTDDTELPMSCY